MTREVQDWPVGEQAPHRVPLGGTTWSVWRDVVLRSAGFPADMVLAICDEPLPRSADQASTGLADDAVYADAARWLSGAVTATIADPDASYLQRHCLKNDTIGFFGPVGWASVAPGTAGLAVTPGNG